MLKSVPIAWLKRLVISN